MQYSYRTRTVCIVEERGGRGWKVEEHGVGMVFSVISRPMPFVRTTTGSGLPEDVAGLGASDDTEVEQLGWVACYWDGEVVHLVTALAHKVQLDQRNSHGVATEFVAGIRALCLPSLALPRANPVRTVRGSGMS
jgi:hypothetical protein